MQKREGIQHLPGGEGEQTGGEGHGEEVATVERRHGGFFLFRPHYQDSKNGCHETHCPGHQGEHDAVDAKEGQQSDSQDHGPDVLGRRGLEEVGATAGAVADVIAHQVRHDRGVARIVLRDTRLDLAHEVRPDIRRLGVDPASQLGK